MIDTAATIKELLMAQYIALYLRLSRQAFVRGHRWSAGNVQQRE